MRRFALLVLVLPLAACGSRHAAPKVPVTPAHLLGPGAHILYSGGNWAVVTKGNTAIAAHLVRGVWTADRSGAVKLEILGPNGKAPTTPQVAVQMTAKSHLIEEGLWVDGVELTEKGGGLTPEKVTVYGAPTGKLAPGKHRAIAYGRTDAHGSAVTWTFTVV
ncbi:MAG TPA: hypothetical protein VGU02_02065 [Gaiellaceae bacterium]|nr:hypothetical protein [Gaiellaceae bacterium]